MDWNIKEVYIGSAPAGEDCAQVGNEQYRELGKFECRLLAEVLIKMYGNPPDGARLIVKANPHDFGTYYELVCKYEDDKEEATKYAYQCEELPERWPDWAMSRLITKCNELQCGRNGKMLTQKELDDARLKKLMKCGSTMTIADAFRAKVEENRKISTKYYSRK